MRHLKVRAVDALRAVNARFHRRPPQYFPRKVRAVSALVTARPAATGSRHTPNKNLPAVAIGREAKSRVTMPSKNTSATGGSQAPHFRERIAGPIVARSHIRSFCRSCSTPQEIARKHARKPDEFYDLVAIIAGRLIDCVRKKQAGPKRALRRDRL
jgi:hypothetical protein